MGGSRVSNSKSFLQAVADTLPPCTSEDPELFFPSYHEENIFQIKQAKAVCRKCNISNACLEFALETGDRYAVLGGTTPAERDTMRKRMAEQERRAA